MPIQILIGLIAGFAAAFMLYSAALGPSFAGFVLSLTSMLPIFLAGLGWGRLTAGIAALTSAVIFAAIAGPAAGGVWLVSQALPVLLLCHYASLNRDVPAPGNASSDATPASIPAMVTQWYPVGSLLTIAGIAGGALASLSLLLLGGSAEAIRSVIATALPKFIKKFPNLAQQKISPEQFEQIADIALYALPVASAIVCVLVLLFNFWLAARITFASGRLMRPWPDLAAMTLPPTVALGLTVSLAGVFFLSDMAGLVATAFAGAFLFVYVCLGLAILHYVTRGNPYRGFILWAVYFALIVLNTYAMPALAIIGLAEPISPLRRRFNRPAPPPNNNRNSNT